MRVRSTKKKMAYCYSRLLRQRIVNGDEPAWIARHSRAVYIRLIILSTPDWVDRTQLRRMHKEARRRGLVVDHIVPVTHALVCGLTVPWNLRLITRRENAARSNRWWEFTADLFSLPEQLRLL